MAGFFIGASIAENEGARTWIFVITAGTFTYIALVDLVRNCSIFVYVDFIVCVYIFIAFVVIFSGQHWCPTMKNLIGFVSFVLQLAIF
jgi:hypothetical protein